ncbi:MAG: beta-ketoacyl synthase [Flavobacteriaceae bacterium]|nr:beta-ketoacyl synthase [Flavobacteriaceae bacterium]
MQQPISITAIHSISALGSSPKKVWEQYLNDQCQIKNKTIGSVTALMAALAKDDRKEIEGLRLSNDAYKDLDDSVLYAIYVSRKVVSIAGWDKSSSFGVNIGSSRGATALFEKYYQSFLEKSTSETLSSPTTTLGNISSWVAQDLKSKGPDISHSITCSTGLHALLNGVAWLQSGMADQFLIGASEAALTDFTIAQMQALRVYAKRNIEYPCKALDLHKNHNTMVLGEAAASICLEKEISEKTIAIINGVGYATESISHNASISAEATCFQDAMKMAIKDKEISEIDIVITHTPGTIKGDIAEIKAIEKVFDKNKPAITTNKWKLGHTFATSGLLSLELAVLMLQHQEFISVPYLKEQDKPKQIRNIIVNAVGFGGNAVSVLISSP